MLALRGPYGDIVCTECAGDGAADEPRTGGTDDAAIARCLAMATYEGPLPRIVRAYKDAGERRLARLLSEMLLDCALHAELAAPERYGGILSAADAVCFVPATAAAFRRRGSTTWSRSRVPWPRWRACPSTTCCSSMGRATSARTGGRVVALPPKGVYEAVHGLEGVRVLLVDDVVTTGATMGAAAGALRRAGAVRVDALALARVWGG